MVEVVVNNDEFMQTAKALAIEFLKISDGLEIHTVLTALLMTIEFMTDQYEDPDSRTKAINLFIIALNDHLKEERQ